MEAIQTQFVRVLFQRSGNSNRSASSPPLRRISRIRLITLGIVTLILSQTNSYAQLVAQDGSVRVVREHIDYDINANGTGTVNAELALAPVIRNAINEIGQRTIDYQEGMSSIEVFEAYTLKADGRRINVDLSTILTQVPPAYANAAMYADMKVKRIIFPDVSIGDQVVYRYQRTILTPRFPGQYFDSQVFPKSGRHDDVRVTVRHLKSQQLQFHIRDLQAEPVQETETHLTHAWHYSSLQAIPEEPGAVNTFDRDPVFEVSSFNSWGAIADAYDARAKGQAAVTPEIKQMADKITENIKGKRAQSNAIYYWVASNIRYVAIFLGAGGYVPHSANSILANRYGDCKDYVTLTEALLAAKGIASTPVLMNAFNRFTVPSIPTPTAFNHAILYLPEFKLYLDPTARTLPFGVLLPIEANKLVLHARNLNELVRTPAIVAKGRELNSHSTLNIGDDGSLKGFSLTSGIGSMSSDLRQFVALIEEPQRAKQYATALLSVEGLIGTATFADKSDPGVAGYKANVAVENWLSLPGPGASRLPTGLLSASSIRVIVMQALNSPPAKVEHLCIPTVLVETATFGFPNSVTPVLLPKDLDIGNSVATYRSTYTVEGRTVRVLRTLSLNYSRTICTPEELSQLRGILEQVGRDTAAQMTFQ